MFHTEGSWTLKVGKVEGKWPWTFPSKWVDITRRCRSSWYDKFLSKRTRLVTFPSWNCQFYVLPDFCYILKHFCRILLKHSELKVWFLSRNRILTNQPKWWKHPTSSFSIITIYQSYWLLEFNHQNSIYKQTFKAKKLQRMQTWSFLN